MNKAVDYYIWRCNCIASLPGNPNWHSHPAIQLYFSCDKEITVETEEEIRCGNLLVIPSHSSRRIFSEGPIIQFAFNPIALEQKQIHKVAALQTGTISRELIRCANFFQTNQTESSAQELKSTLQKTLTSLLHTLPMDTRVQCAFTHLVENYQWSICTQELAANVKLSPSRLQHLFKQQTGIAIGQYQQWLRLRMSFQLIAQGRKPISAALESGFSDQAHFSRLFKRAFGYTPSELLKRHGKARINIMEPMLY